MVSLHAPRGACPYLPCAISKSRARTRLVVAWRVVRDGLLTRGSALAASGPALLLLDEIDALATSREKEMHEVRAHDASVAGSPQLQRPCIDRF